MRRLVLLWCVLCSWRVLAVDALFYIDTGYFGGVYYEVGEDLARALTKPARSLPCQQGGGCGISGQVFVGRSSTGSLQNLRALCAGETDSALAQSNLVYLAYRGDLFAKACDEVRAVASLYPEVLQVVVREDSEFFSLADLSGRKVAVGNRESGSYEALLSLFALQGGEQLYPVWQFLSLEESMDALLSSEVDAIAFFAGTPAPLFLELSEGLPLRLLSIDKNWVDPFLKNNPYFTRVQIAQGLYGSDVSVSSIAVHALWLVRADADEKLVYEMVHRLWQLDRLAAVALDFSQALQGIGIPLHQGAARFYEERGKRY